MEIFNDNQRGGVRVFAAEDPAGNEFDVITAKGKFSVYFQNGSPADAGFNGLTNEAAIAILLHRLQVLQGKAPCAENLRAIGHLQLANAALMERAERMKAQPAQVATINNTITTLPDEQMAQLRETIANMPPAYLVPGEQAYRRVTPHECPQCHALWLFWPKERSGLDQDTLNLRSNGSCPYCEAAGVENLIDLNAVDAGVRADAMPAATPSQDQATLGRLEIVHVNDEAFFLRMAGCESSTFNHDAHGWDGLQAAEDAARFVCEQAGVHVDVVHEDEADE